MTTRTKLVPLFGTGYSSPWSSVMRQQMVNMYPRKNGDRADITFIHTPGYTLESTGPEGTGYPCRGGITTTSGIVLAAFKNKVYRYMSYAVGWLALTGTLNNSTGEVHFAQSATEILFTDGEKLWRTTNLTSFAEVTVTPTSHGSIAYLANRFVMVDKASAKFYWSELDDGNTWDALSFASMEGEPGKAAFVHSCNGYLVLFGYFTTEFWAPVEVNVFQRVGAYGIPVGVGSYGVTRAPLMTESGIYFMGQPLHGGLPQPYVIRNFQITSLAEPNVVTAFHAQQGLGTANEITYYAYKEASEEFVVFNLNSTSVAAMQYNVSSSTWTRLGDPSGSSEWNINRSIWQSGGLATTLSYYLMFDKTSSASVYKLSASTYTYNGTAISRRLITRHIVSDLNPITIHELTLDMEAGVGTTGGDATPLVKLEVSIDRGHTFTDYGSVSFGASGQYTTKPTWYRLGTADDWVFRFTTTNGVPFVVNGGAVRISS